MQSSKLIGCLLALLLIQSQVTGQPRPKYAAMVGGLRSGPISRGAFLAQQGVGGSRQMANNHWESIIIDSFCIVIIRDTGIVTQMKNKGKIFTPSTKAQISKVAMNDRVIIYAIYGRDYGEKKVSVPPVELVIE